ncbi:MAG: PorT family protein [Bacteroidales bacterium]|nr:PorT family protein [Bacteroidales bacterium]
MRKRLFITSLLFSILVSSFAQHDRNIDRFGRDKDDKITSGGLLVSADVNSLWIHKFYGFNSTPSLGVSLGGFIDFKVTRGFVIESNLILNHETTRFSDGGEIGRMTTDGMILNFVFSKVWTMKNNGLWYLGAGPYTEFVLHCKTKFGNDTFDPYNQLVGTGQNGENIFALSNNNSGLCLKTTYEFPFHLQLFLYGSMSISDIIGFNHNEKQFIRPYRCSIGVAYRFR